MFLKELLVSKLVKLQKKSTADKRINVHHYIHNNAHLPRVLEIQNLLTNNSNCHQLFHHQFKRNNYNDRFQLKKTIY
jgi:hypothetical protein